MASSTSTKDPRAALARDLSADALRERLRWARRQGHEAWVWPEVPIADWRASLAEIERVTRVMVSAGVPDEGSLGHPDGGPSTASFTLPLDATVRARLEPPCGVLPLGIAAFTSGMGPLLGHWIDRGAIEAEPGVAALLADHLDHGRRRARLMREATVAAVSLLADAGIRVVLVKSAHTAAVYFADPDTRPAADIDLVVDASALEPAEAALARAGHVMAKRTRRPAKSDWTPPGVSTRLRSLDLSHADNPFTIELHAGLDRDFFGVRTVRFGPLLDHELAEAPAPFRPAFVLRQPLLAAYLAVHASEELHQLQLVRILELAMVLRRDARLGALDWSALKDRLRSCDALRFAFPALELAERLSPGALEGSFRERLHGAATPRMRRVVARVGPGTAQRLDGVSLEERLVWARGPVETARRLWRLISPFSGDARTMLRILARRLIRLAKGRVSIRR
ncbi:MAG: nucleotidyltransferase family protein [Gemmatimonadetes bacterium]|nr:nucleotidyltransferase family protein [Gemmatimonadota bacterium]